MILKGTELMNPQYNITQRINNEILEHRKTSPNVCNLYKENIFLLTTNKNIIT